MLYFSHPACLEHDPGMGPPGHPERPERILAARDALRGAGLEQMGQAVGVRAAREEELGRVHTAGYLAELTRIVPGQSGCDRR